MDKPSWKVVIVAAIITIFAGLLVNECDAAEPHAIVSFNSPEHLVALTDSVVGIVDSTFTTSDSCLEGYTKSRYYGSMREVSYVYYFRWIVTRRELVSLTVMCYPWKAERKAIINYREVKQ